MKELQKNKKNQNYYFNQHNCFLLQYHLVLITKYRKPVLVDKIKDFFLNYTRNYFTEKDLNILEINTNENHVHILFECGTNINLSPFKNDKKKLFKRINSILLETLFLELFLFYLYSK